MERFLELRGQHSIFGRFYYGSASSKVWTTLPAKATNSCYSGEGFSHRRQFHDLNQAVKEEH